MDRFVVRIALRQQVPLRPVFRIQSTASNTARVATGLRPDDCPGCAPRGQKAIERAPRSLQQTQLFATCHVKTPILSIRLKLGFPYKLRDADHDAADGSVAGFVLKS